MGLLTHSSFIMSPDSLSFLKNLLSTPSPSGFELEGQRVWKSRVAPIADKIESDAYGNLFVHLNPGRTPRIVITGHSDELGLMISHISDEGFLFFTGIGGVDRTLLKGQRVTIHTKKGPVRGVIGSLAIHLQEPDDRKKSPEFHELFIDIGASSKNEAAQLVRIGDPATIASDVWELSGSRLAARGCDNRIGTWTAAETLHLLSKNKSQLQTEVVAVSTIQEENGLYGATMASYRIHPSIVVAVDVTHATDIPICTKSKHGETRLGAGPVISRGSANHPLLVERFIHVAEKNKIPYQLEANPRSTGTDADAFFIQKGGMPTISLGLPNRYMHSPVEVIDLDDLDALAQLIAAFCLSVTNMEEFYPAV